MTREHLVELGAAPARYGDVGVVVQERFGDRRSDAGSPTGDQNRPALEVIGVRGLGSRLRAW
jgi:hypothetical protein